MIKRIRNRLDAEIPTSQAAYRKGRSTTEHIFSPKMIIERTISARKEAVHLLLLDISKAFDSIRRETLIKDLESVINPDEIHWISIFFNVKLAVK